MHYESGKWHYGSFDFDKGPSNVRNCAKKTTEITAEITHSLITIRNKLGRNDFVR